MTNLKSIKYRITEAVVNELPVDVKGNIGDIDSLLTKYWTSGRQDGLRLTELGDHIFKTADIEFFDFNLDYDIKNNPHQEWYSFLLECNKKIKCPYYIGVTKIEGKKNPYIRFYDSKIAVMVQLYGSIKDYLNSVKEKR